MKAYNKEIEHIHLNAGFGGRTSTIYSNGDIHLTQALKQQNLQLTNLIDHISRIY